MVNPEKIWRVRLPDGSLYREDFRFVAKYGTAALAERVANRLGGKAIHKDDV